MQDYLTLGPPDAGATLILAHGAGAPMDTPFMNAFAEGIAAAGVRVVRFEFPYMARRRTTGKRSGPGSAHKLLDFFVAVVDVVGATAADQVVVGGKSMGGRVASMIVESVDACGAICLGYPFHPPGRPEQLRTDHLQQVSKPILIVQGTRDAFGNQSEVLDYPLAESVRVHWIADGDHSLKPRKSSGRTQQQNWQEGIAAAVEFIQQLTS